MIPIPIPIPVANDSDSDSDSSDSQKYSNSDSRIMCLDSNSDSNKPGFDSYSDSGIIYNSGLHPTSLLICSIIHGSYFNVLLQSKMREEDWEMIKISMIKMSNSYKNLMVCSYCHYFKCWSFHWSNPVAVCVCHVIFLQLGSVAVNQPLIGFHQATIWHD